MSEEFAGSCLSLSAMAVHQAARVVMWGLLLQVEDHRIEEGIGWSPSGVHCHHATALRSHRRSVEIVRRLPQVGC